MTSDPDTELLHRYADERDEAAFAELVRRHLALVYSAALRQLDGATHRAEEVTQSVFTDLARKAATLSRRDDLAGWLYTSTHFAAAKLKRTEQRRQWREQEAHAMNEILTASSSGDDWERLRPVLDDAMHELAERDREVILQRFFQGCRFAEVGEKLGLSEDAARMCVERALEKLGALLARRGITSTASALGLVLENQAMVAAPVGLAATVAGAAVTANGSAVVAGIFTFMSTTQVAPAVAVIAALIAVGAAIHNMREARLADARLAIAVRENVSAAARLRELARRAEAAARQTAALQQAAAGRSRLAEAAKATPVPATPVEDQALRAGRELLATNPEARRLVDRIVRTSAENNYGTTLRAMGLSVDERERVLAAAVAAIESMRISFPGVSFEYGSEHPELQREAWQRILGQDNFRRFEELRRKDRTNAIVKTLATATYESDTPLLPAQVRALSDAIERHTAPQKTEGTRMIFSLDWDAIGKDAGRVLSAPQAALFAAALRQGAPATVKQEIPTR